MLRGEQWYMMRDLLRDGVSISEIARRTGCDRKTIRKLRDQPAHPQPAPRRPRPGLLDPFKPYLAQRLARGVLNASKLHAEIQKQGYAGGVAVVRRFVSPLRPRTPVVVERFETPPGRQAQGDWTSCGHLWEGERRRALSAFVLTLGYSRRQYVEFTLRQDLEHFLRCHVHAFAYFGGIPHDLLYDNLKTAVDHRLSDGSIVWNSRFRDFADYYGFTPRACRPYRAQTKGKVERGAGYRKGNFLLGLDLAAHTVETLNRDVLGWLRETADVRIHGTTHERPAARWPAEQAALQALGSRLPFDTSYVTPRLVSREAVVSYHGLRVEVPPEHAGRVVLVKEDEAGWLRLYHGADCIATHRVPTTPVRRLALPEHAAAVRALARRRPPAPAEPPRTAPAWPEVEVRTLARYDELVGLGEGAR
jgi:transposase